MTAEQEHNAWRVAHGYRAQKAGWQLRHVQGVYTLVPAAEGSPFALEFMALHDPANLIKQVRYYQKVPSDWLTLLVGAIYRA